MTRPYRDYLKVANDIAQAELLLTSADTDAEMHALIEDELKELRPKRDACHTRLEDLLLGEGEDYGSIIVEIRAGTGGDEAALFAGDLYDMYTHYARDKGWKVEDIAFSQGEAGGFKEAVFGIFRRRVFQHLRYESGGHRVQRVPKTETQGRIHTSLATVAVLPEPDEVQVEVKDQEIEWERMRAGGAGGQHVNKTESAVRIWYRRGTADEMEVKCQDERSQPQELRAGHAHPALAALRAPAAEAAQRPRRAAPHPDRLRRARRAHPTYNFRRTASPTTASA